jgi:PDZ domain-containing protein
MFALSIVDKLTDEDLTGGMVVAGTGTIGLDGTVGAIGGIQQKVPGALSRGEEPPAEVFLVPRGNVEEARSAAVPSPILLVPVDTLDDAVQALQDLRAGATPDGAFELTPPR